MSKARMIRASSRVGPCVVSVAALGIAFTPGAAAQECVFPPIPSGVPAEPPPIFSGVFVASPPAGIEMAPLNVEIRLGGSIAELDTVPPSFAFELIDDGGARVPVVREGRVARPVEALRPSAVYTARVSPTDTNPCVGCFVPHEVVFTTGVDEDHEPPELLEAPRTVAFALPAQAERERCGIFTTETHSIVIDIDPSLPRDTTLAVAARAERADPVFATEVFLSGQALSLVTSAGAVPVMTGSALFVAFTPRDLAGNVGRAVVVRARAHAPRDAALTDAELTDLTCDVAPELRVRAADPVPQNGLIHIAFPFEEQPVSLRADDGSLIALVPVEEMVDGQVYAPGSPLPPGEHVEVVTRPCPHCVCEGCADAVGATLEVSDRDDDSPPAAPRVLEFDEELEPEPATGACHADRPALIVVIEKGKDDQTDARALRYRARVKLDDGPTVELGDGHAPVERDGAFVLRLETPGLPRLLGDPFTLTLDVKDGAGNSARTTKSYDPDAPAETSGCRATGAPLSGALAALAVAMRARRRSRRVA